MIVDRGEFTEERLGDLPIRGDDNLASLGIDHVQRDLLAQQDVTELLGQLLTQGIRLLLMLVFNLFALPFNLGRCQVFPRRLLARGHLDIHDNPVGATRHGQRRVFYIGCLFTKDRP